MAGQRRRASVRRTTTTTVIAGGIKKVPAERETRIKKEDGKMKRVEEG